eukprot:1998469-Amphidinium_carterae.1
MCHKRDSTKTFVSPQLHTGDEDISPQKGASLCYNVTLCPVRPKLLLAIVGPAPYIRIIESHSSALRRVAGHFSALQVMPPNISVPNMQVVVEAACDQDLKRNNRGSKMTANSSNLELQGQ